MPGSPPYPRIADKEKDVKKLTLDWWSVLAALAAVALVRSGILPAVRW